MIKLRRLQADDTDLAAVVAQLNDPVWEDFDNKFSEQSLREFLSDPSRVYLLAYADDKLAGAAHGYLMPHPAGPKYFYIDEVDTARPFRRQGVATAMMDELFRLAEEMGAEEAWLGADEGNDAAYALYRKLKPSAEEPGMIFTFKVGNGR